MIRIAELSAIVFAVTFAGVAQASPVTVNTTGASDGAAQYYASWGGGSSSYTWSMVTDQTTATTSGSYSKFFASSTNYYIVLNFPMVDVASHWFDPNTFAATLDVYFEYASAGTKLLFHHSGAGAATIHQDHTYGTVVTTFTQAGPGWASFDVTSAVATALDNDWDWVAFAFHRQEDGYSAVARTSEYEGFAPSLTVVPEPATMALLGVGGIAALLRRRNMA